MSRPPSGPVPRYPFVVGAVVVAVAVGFGIARLTALSTEPPGSMVEARATPSLLVSVRDLARLETTDLHIEKVIDLTDKQSHFFGLLQATDAMLLVAAGDVTIGIDLSKLGEGDVSIDPTTHIATMRLPAPEILSTRLDEKSTYVYTRTTDLLAKRNEQLESRARQEAVAALEKAAREADVTARAKAQAERQLRGLASQLGATSVEITWR
jgi:hypothetical protein